MASGRPAGSGAVRIIGGDWRGRTVRFEDAPGLRPSTDRTRETLFNWLQGRVAGRCVLDLFAGSGVLGFEAVSRGASGAVLVEHNAAVTRRLAEQAAKFDSARLEVVHADALAYLEQAGETGRFDIVFVDPPFTTDTAYTVLEALRVCRKLQPDALIYLEVAAGQQEALDGFGSLDILKHKTAGNVWYGLLRFHSSSVELE